jgi:general secretion pathway protein H
VAAATTDRQGGFTLLEILVVVLIIAVMTAGFVLSLNFAGHDTALETESRRLLALMHYAREQAELQTRDYGIVFDQHGYEFVVFSVRRDIWRRVFEDDALRARTLPRGLEFRLIVDARRIVLDDRIGKGSLAPQVVLYSSGDLSSFDITLERPGTSHRVSIEENRNGRIIERPKAPESAS